MSEALCPGGQRLANGRIGSHSSLGQGSPAFLRLRAISVTLNSAKGYCFGNIFLK